MKKIIILIVFSILFLLNSKIVNAVYDPSSVPNNKFGIHILFPSEISEAANLINSSGGDWGYVTIPIQDSDRDLIKWQIFMDDCSKYHIIPIIRIATEGDYFVKGSWKIPSNYYVIDFANFLNSLDWPTKNRYVMVFNEPNRGDEWGGTPDAASYAKILNSAVDEFKKRSDKFFIISAGFDNASVNVSGVSVNQLDYMRQMNEEAPGIFAKIDGLGAHAYPNPAFSTSPSFPGQTGISSFKYQEDLVSELGGKQLPIFITETGWSTDKISPEVQSEYYKEAFQGAWNDKSVIAVTPFIFKAGGGPFAQFSFTDSNNKSLYDGYLKLSKTKGAPKIEPETIQTVAKSVALRTKYFSDQFTKSITNVVNAKSKIFFKWLLNI